MNFKELNNSDKPIARRALLGFLSGTLVVGLLVSGLYARITKTDNINWIVYLITVIATTLLFGFWGYKAKIEEQTITKKRIAIVLKIILTVISVFFIILMYEILKSLDKGIH